MCHIFRIAPLDKGVNVTDMAIVTTVVSYAVFRGLVKVLPRRRSSVTAASFAAALLSVPAAVVAFTLMYALGGTTDVPIGRVATAMIGVHALIGLGEAVITALTVGAVVAVRPDLVHGARGLRQRLRLRVGGELVDAPAAEPAPAAALEGVGMQDFADRPPHHLPFGQRRRVAVATVLAMEPEILVLDEPSSNLDPASRRELADILRSLDVTVLMVTHDLPYALELCPRPLVLSDGVIAADGPTGTLLCDEELMRAHRLELPFGFDPRSVTMGA
ncbi:energy-coupling factor ABC transporter permease [Streptomyces tropicalis]|uniref:Energy-coupling factor ABC transporter permease n=1 Tax=Streptomyces tropicalis TaxID=3034234 RepID=A0ABT6ADS4_9ACTN|nr:energy-coupling factor ABC transporter permease [Streptomyces tropicalis]MDF3302802.1 energy-coupling factor ABC transporter permease [Streptomyces tropicalis]